jgi:DNA-binding NtrC family response regulator
MKSFHILCVDDEAYVAEGLSRLLHQESISVHSALSVEEAMEKLSKTRFDAVLADEYMPGSLGSHFLSLVRDRWPLIVRIAMTGMPGQQAFMRAFQDGVADSFLIKPFEKARLMSILALARRVQ